MQTSNSTQTLVPVHKMPLDQILNHFHVTIRLKPEDVDIGQHASNNAFLQQQKRLYWTIRSDESLSDRAGKELYRFDRVFGPRI